MFLYLFVKSFNLSNNWDSESVSWVVPNIVNNIYASPNKIYDGIQAGVPVIINQEVLVSAFVREKKLGVVLDSYSPTHISAVLEELKTQRNQFTHIAKMQGKYTWEKIEPVLISAHLKS